MVKLYEQTVRRKCSIPSEIHNLLTRPLKHSNEHLQNKKKHMSIGMSIHSQHSFVSPTPMKIIQNLLKSVTIMHR